MENHGGLISSNKTSLSLFPPDQRGLSQALVSQTSGTWRFGLGACCRSTRTETKRQIKSWCGAMPWIIRKGEYCE